MSFREKSAWVTLITILFVSGVYLTHGVPWTLTPQPSGWMLHALVGAAIGFIVIEVVAHIILYARHPKDALTPKDERERLITLKSERIAAYVYAVGSLSSLSLIHIGANAIAIANAILMAFVLAEIVNYTARIIYFRRGI